MRQGISRDHHLIEAQAHRIRERLHADCLGDAGRIDVEARPRVLLRHNLITEMLLHSAQAAPDTVIQIAQDKLRDILRIAEIVISDCRHHEIRCCTVGSEIFRTVLRRIDLRADIPVHIPMAIVDKR